MKSYIKVRCNLMAPLECDGQSCRHRNHPEHSPMSKLKAICLVAGLLQCGVPLVQAQSKDSSADRQTAPDNTRANKADRNNAQPTAQDQSNAKSDRDLAAAVRKAITQDKSLSTYAHNVKVVVHDGSVTLRGPVRSGDEKTKVAE